MYFSLLCLIVQKQPVELELKDYLALVFGWLQLLAALLSSRLNNLQVVESFQN